MTTYTIKPKNSIEIEVGDIKQPDFYPQVKFKKWNNEVNFSARLLDNNEHKSVPIEQDNRIIWQKGSRRVQFYEVPGSGEHPDGAYEFEVTLLERPSSNIVEMSIQTKGLEFSYQPPLTQDEVDKGCIRPDNVVGSYAVYYKNYPKTAKYGCGKVLHIYRPRIEDAQGNWVWGELNIDVNKELLTVTIPQTFIDTAVYPITHCAGLTFGYTAVGASEMYTMANMLFGYNVAGTVGTISKMTCYGYSTTANKHVKGVIAKVSDKSLITGGVSDATIVPTTKQWFDIPYSSAPAIMAQDYFLCVISDNEFRIFYDQSSEDGNPRIMSISNSYDSPNPSTGAVINSGHHLSAYVTCTSVAKPVVNISSVSRTRLSGQDQCNVSTIKFTVDADCLSWVARATNETQTPSEGAGVQIHSGNEITKDAEVTFTVENSELVQGDREYTVAIYVTEKSVVTSNPRFFIYNNSSWRMNEISPVTHLDIGGGSINPGMAIGNTGGAAGRLFACYESSQRVYEISPSTRLNLSGSGVLHSILTSGIGGTKDKLFLSFSAMDVYELSLSTLLIISAAAHTGFTGGLSGLGGTANRLYIMNNVFNPDSGSTRSHIHELSPTTRLEVGSNYIPGNKYSGLDGTDTKLFTATGSIIYELDPATRINISGSGYTAPITITSVCGTKQ